jgi:hypothetical protein
VDGLPDRSFHSFSFLVFFLFFLFFTLLFSHSFPCFVSLLGQRSLITPYDLFQFRITSEVMNQLRLPWRGTTSTQALDIHITARNRKTRKFILEHNGIQTHDTCVGSAKTHAFYHIFVFQICKALQILQDEFGNPWSLSLHSMFAVLKNVTYNHW